MAAGHALPDKVRKGDAKRDRGNRTGFTTGANSAAAAAAATLGLVQGEPGAAHSDERRSGDEHQCAARAGTRRSRSHGEAKPAVRG